MTYEKFVKQMKSNGYTWDDIEYYWRHQNKLDEEFDYTLTEAQQKEREMWQRIARI